MTLVVGVGVAHAVDARGQREHRLAGAAGALDHREPAPLGRLDRRLDTVGLFGVRFVVAEHRPPRLTHHPEAGGVLG